MRSESSLSRRGLLLIVLISPALLGSEWKCAMVSNPTVVTARIDLIEPDAPRAGDMVQVTGRGEGTPPLQFAWDFGDNTFAGGMQAAHVYVAPGTYNITLTVRDANGNLNADSTQLMVSARQAASFLEIVQLSHGVAREPVVLTALAFEEDGSERIYSWTFSDGQSALGPLVARTFPAAGTYVATVSAVNDFGESAVGQIAVQVMESAD